MDIPLSETYIAINIRLYLHHKDTPNFDLRELFILYSHLFDSTLLAYIMLSIVVEPFTNYYNW